MKALTTEIFRAHLQRYLDAVAQEGETLVIARGDAEGTGVVVMSLAEYDRHRSRDHAFLYGTPQNTAATERSFADVAAGRVKVVGLEELERIVGVAEVLDSSTRVQS